MHPFSLDFLSPHRTVWLLLAPAVLALAVWVYYRTVAPLKRPARAVLRALRGLAFLIVLFALGEPVLTLFLPEPGKPGLAVLIDDSASMRFPGDAGGRPRASEAAAVVAKIEERLGGQFRLQWFGFGTALRPRDGGKQKRGEAVAGEKPTRADGSTDSTGANAKTDGNTAIGDVLDALAGRQGSRPVGGILILTDGASTVGSDPVGAARNAGVPIYPIRIGGDLTPPDARVLSVRTNPVAFVGEPIPVEIEIASSGLDGQSVELSIEDQGRVLGSRPVSLTGAGDLEQSIRLDVRPVAAGLRRWEIRIKGQKDAVPENDTRAVAVRVMERKTRILVLEGRLDWDHTFLRRTLSADSTFSYRFLLCDKAGRWLPERGGARGTSGPGDLREYAAVLLGEVPAAALGSGFYSELSHYVEQGGGLLILGGRSGIARCRGTALDRVLPAEVIPGGVSDRPLPVRLLQAGLTHPVTAVEDSPSRSEAAWASLPPVWPSPDRLRVKPGASALLGLADKAGTEPMMVVGFSGDGKVALLAAHDFWRWEFLPRGTTNAPSSGEAFGEFTLRMIRWLAEPSMRDRFTAEPVRGVFQNGEAPEFGARVWDEQYDPVPDARVTIKILPAEGATDPPLRQFDLTPRGGDGTFVGGMHPLPPGAYRYVAEARSANASKSYGRVESTFWVDTNGPEYVRLRPDAGTLQQIANASGGESISQAGLDDLLSRLPRVVRRVGRVREIELWNHLALFLSFVALLSVEWFLRRRRGLA